MHHHSICNIFAVACRLIKKTQQLHVTSDMSGTMMADRDTNIAMLMGMGATIDQATEILDENKGDIDLAMAQFCNTKISNKASLQNIYSSLNTTGMSNEQYKAPSTQAGLEGIAVSRMTMRTMLSFPHCTLQKSWDTHPVSNMSREETGHHWKKRKWRNKNLLLRRVLRACTLLNNGSQVKRWMHTVLRRSERWPPKAKRLQA